MGKDLLGGMGEKSKHKYIKALNLNKSDVYVVRKLMIFILQSTSHETKKLNCSDTNY